MSALYLNLYGFRISLVTSNDAHHTVLSKFQEDFYHFLDSDIGVVNLKIIIDTAQTHNQNSGYLIGKTRMASVYHINFKQRLYKYRKGDKYADLIVSFSGIKAAKIFSNDENLIYEILYIFVLSQSGEYFDKNGLMRIHAMGVRSHKQTTVFYGSRGTGKSTLFTSLITDKSSAFYSDELCLLDIKDSLVKPFPIRIALNDETLKDVTIPRPLSNLKRLFLDEKKTYPFPKDQLAPPDTIKNFVILGPFKGRNKISPATGYFKFKFYFEFVLGIGLIQMAEFILRPDNITGILKIFYNRLRSLHLINQSSLYLWQRSGNLDEDVRFISDFIVNTRKK